MLSFADYWIDNFGQFMPHKDLIVIAGSSKAVGVWVGNKKKRVCAVRKRRRAGARFCFNHTPYILVASIQCV